MHAETLTPTPTWAPLRVLATAGVIAMAVVWSASQRDFGPDGYGLAWKGALIVALGLAPAWVQGWSRARGAAAGASIPFVPLVGAIHALFFGAPLLLSDRVQFMSLEPPVAALQGAADLVLLGLIALYAGYAGAARLPLGRPLRLHCDGRRGAPAAMALIAIGFAARILVREQLLPEGLLQPAALLAHGVLLGAGLLIVLGRRGHLGRWAAPLAIAGVLPAHLLLELSSGSLGYAVRDGAFALMLIWGTGGRVPLVVLAALGLFIMGLRGAANEYRVVLHNSPHLLEDRALERGLQFFELARSELEREGASSITASAFGRFSQIALFAEVVDKTPLAIPHWGGATYATLPATFVPRALWPDKPAKELGQRFGHRYGVLHETDTTTSINLPQLVEHYVNFGALGVLLGSLAIGLVYRVLVHLLVHPAAGEAGLVFGVLFASRLLHVESDTSLVLGIVLQLALLCAPLAWFLAPRAGAQRATLLAGALR